MTTEAQLIDWLERYRAAWEGLDADAAAELFTHDAMYYETPYAEAFVGQAGVRDYWAGVTADQSDVAFTYEVIGVADGTGVARWNTKLRTVSTGDNVELDGVFLLEMEEGRCRVLREWWHFR